MSTDPKKYIRTIVLTFIIACFMMIIGMNMAYHYLPVVVFTLMSVLLLGSAILSLKEQYKKYHIRLYLFLAITGSILVIIMLILAITTIIQL